MFRIAVGLACLSVGWSLIGLGCQRTESKVLMDLRGVWETTAPSGDLERIHFDVQTVTYAHGTERAFTCPYRVNAYHEKESLIELRIKCKQRTGADEWIDYRLEFQPGRRAFTLLLDDRELGTFRRSPDS